MGMGAGMQAPEGSSSSASRSIKLYVGSLHTSINERMLRDLFSPFGTLKSCELARDEVSRASMGYAFVTVCCINIYAWYNNQLIS